MIVGKVFGGAGVGGGDGSGVHHSGVGVGYTLSTGRFVLPVPVTVMGPPELSHAARAAAHAAASSKRNA